ncbi:tubulin gamma-1 chain, partial [Trifolium medium]|nr:tubulin gamma-1 chain [Trifolium medium]
IRHGLFGKCLSQYDKFRRKQAFSDNYGSSFRMFADPNNMMTEERNAAGSLDPKSVV